MTEPMRSPAVDGSTGNVPDRPSQDVVLGLHEAHRRVGAATARLFDTAAHAYAVTELLVRKGVIEVDELDRSRRDVEERLGSAFGDDGLEISIAAEGPDKYELGEQAVEIDCAARLPLCRAACCRLRFPLSEQDIHEGVVRWQLDRPYLNLQNSDGYCVHCTTGSRTCGVYVNRPGVCRTYDCRKDTRIWVDFEARVPQPDLP
jgi:hypothetical protein